MHETSTCRRTFSIWKKLWSNMEMIRFLFIENFVNLKIFMVLCENKKLTVEILSKKEHIFLRDLPKKCFVKVIKRTKLTAPLRREYDNKIMFTVIVYR